MVISRSGLVVPERGALTPPASPDSVCITIPDEKFSVDFPGAVMSRPTPGHLGSGCGVAIIKAHNAALE